MEIQQLSPAECINKYVASLKEMDNAQRMSSEQKVENIAEREIS